MALPPKIPNTPPENIKIAKKVSFTTTDLSNGSTFVEPHTVTLDNGSYNVPLNFVIDSTGTKIFVPLTTSTGPGSSWLKIHLPQPDESIMYITYAVKSNRMVDGYYDFINGINSTYRAHLRTFILDGLSIPAAGLPNQTKDLKFYVYGLDTNQTQNTIQFTVRFRANFSNSIASTPAGNAVA